MLKITRDAENVGTLRVNLCGRFTSEYIPEVRKALSPNGHKAHRLALDLTNVTFVDRQAMEFLTAAKSRNIKIDNLPSYVTRWMQQEAANGSSPSSAAKK
jgi:anti-anti-sigma regulatory factor